jgi:hypothetical protein
MPKGVEQSWVLYESTVIVPAYVTRIIYLSIAGFLHPHRATIQDVSGGVESVVNSGHQSDHAASRCS